MPEFPEIQLFKPDVASMSQAKATEALIEMECVRLQLKGFDFDYISEKIGISRENAAKAYRAGMSTIRRETKKNAVLLIQEDMARLDMMLTRHLEEAMGGCDKSAKVVLSIMERRAKLRGLDAAIKLQTEERKSPSKADYTKLDESELDKLLELADKANVQLQEEDD